MKVITTKPFDRDFADLPKGVKERAAKQLALLVSNPHHPSLRIKKMSGYPDIWEGRVTKGYRFTFEMQGDIYLLRRIGSHAILEKP